MYFIYKERMIPPKIHSFIQIWSMRTGATTWKETFIETLEGEKEMKLAVTFRSGECVRVFQLGSDSASVCIGRGREEQSCLCLTVPDSTSVFSSTPPGVDGGQLETFLDLFHQSRFQNPVQLAGGWYVLENRNTQVTAGQTLFYAPRPPYGPVSSQNGSGALLSQKTPSLMSKSPAPSKKAFLECKGEKRKKMLPSCLGVNKDVLEEGDLVPNKKRKMQPWKCAGGTGERALSLGDVEVRHSKAGPAARTSPTAGPDPDDAVLSTPALSTPALSKRTGLVFPLTSKHSQHNPNPRRPEAQEAPEAPGGQRWRGLPNLGNTCYMNAVLQSLFGIPSFADGLLMQRIPWERVPPGALITPVSLLLVLKDVCKVETKEELLVSVKDAISAVAEAFRGNQQNDAQEFLGQCLCQVKDEFETLNSTWITEREPQGEDAPAQTGAAATAAAATAFTCPVSANFEFEMQISITCKACGWVVLKTEPGSHLSLNLRRGPEPLPLSVQSALDLFFTAEELEYGCERCWHRRSVFRCGFSRLPRVLIVHLKRYGFNEAWLPVKNDQQVDISKRLILSPHCNANTAPPLPLVGNAPAGDAKVPEVVSQEVMPETTSPSSPSVTLSSESHDPLVPLSGPDKDAEPLEFQRMCEGANHAEQQRGLESEPATPRSRICEERQPRADSAVDEEDQPLPKAPGDRGEPVSTPDSALAEVHLQGVPENPEPQNTEKNNTEGIQGRLEKDMSGPTESRHQGAGQKECGASDSDQRPENQDIAEKAVAEAQGANAVGAEGPCQAYRLVSVVSHVGSFHSSGHYISDVYDFQKQAWFTYNDLKVSEIPEAVMREARNHTGYILFYMHDEIFEVLLEKAASSQTLGIQAEVVPRDDF